MILLQNTTTLAPGNQTPFIADEGVPPYTYSVVPGGAGGTINASTGLYTAPNSGGVDTIRAVDSASTQVQTTISILTPLEIFCSIIKEEMELDDDQVFLYDQKFTVPNDSRLYVAVGILNSKPFGNSNNTIESGADLIEVQSVNMHSTLSIDIFSRSTDALYRKEEVLQALASVYSQQQQEANSFFIAKLPVGFSSISQEEGPAIPYRFNISVNVQYASKKVKLPPIYDTFGDAEIETDL